MTLPPLPQPPKYTPKALRELQAKSRRTNAAFALALGCTQRTWEVWKLGRTKRKPSLLQRRAIAQLEAEINRELESMSCPA